MRAFIRHPVLVSRVIAGCVAAAAPVHAQPTDASALSGQWTGTYQCAQGITALELALRGNAHGIVRGTFAFSATPENPDVPSGRYPVLGRLTGTSLVLRPIDVREMPEEYVPVGVQASVKPGERRMQGWIEGPTCGALRVQRTASAAPADPLPGGYGQQRWTPFPESPDGRLSWDAREPWEPGAGTTRLWVRWAVPPAAPRAELQPGEAMEWDLEIDCRTGLVRVWHTLAYAPDGELREVDASAPYGWRPVVQNSLDQLAYGRACAGVQVLAEQP